MMDYIYKALLIQHSTLIKDTIFASFMSMAQCVRTYDDSTVAGKAILHIDVYTTLKNGELWTRRKRNSAKPSVVPVLLSILSIAFHKVEIMTHYSGN